MPPELIGSTLFYTAIYLFLIAIFASPLLFLFRRGIGAWISRGRWRLPILLAVVVIPVAAFTLRQQMYTPLVAFGPGMAKHWIQQAAAAPTRQERVQLVRRVAESSGEYGGHVAWGAIKDIPDRQMRCEMYDIVAKTPHIKASSNVEEALRRECRD